MIKYTLKLAQVFYVDGNFSPAKASVYLREALYDNSNYFNLDSNPVFEAINFKEIQTGTTSKVYPEDTELDNVSKSYLKSDANGASNYPIIYYPIKAGVTGDFDVWIRRRNPSNNFNVNIYIDGVMEITISDGTSSSWVWSSTTISIENTNVHNLGIQLISDDLYMDEILIQPTGGTVPIGPIELTESPYVTVHAQIYNVTSDNKPSTPLVVHDYKTSLDDIKEDGWYNFDLNFLTTAGATPFTDELYALVLYGSGSREKNFVAWEVVDSDEYLSLPIASEE